MTTLAHRETTLDQLTRDVEQHYQTVFTADEIWRLRNNLLRDGYIRLTELLPRNVMAALQKDVKSIVAKAARRIDITVEHTGNTPRKMSTVNFADITKFGEFAPSLYALKPLRNLLSQVAGHDVRDCEYQPERLTITKQEKPGDTHGWHWGDYQYALIFIIEAPSVDAGGMLQCVPHTTWNKKDPQINRFLSENPIRSYHHDSGDIYFFRTDTTLHRTSPIERDCLRIILNFTYAGPDDLNKDRTHETMEAIYEFA
ncbi:phytanoyl-CoA dioxygenase family protein [uncultured Bradyrhizobium sp.]|uniref:HalD/BesD family halogenase n=1 Tax=uncultured Bradyrhizobium sp. TaxID=199684 RepID=UPI0035C9FC1B